MPRGPKVKVKMPAGNNSAALQAALARQAQVAESAKNADQERIESAMGSSSSDQNSNLPGNSAQNTEQTTVQETVKQVQVAPVQQPIRQNIKNQPPEWYKGSERDLSISIYPIYINKEKSLKEGRRVSSELAVKCPILKDMFMVLQHAGFSAIGEAKFHPKDTFKANPSNIGRLHILFKNKDKTPILPNIAKNKMELLKYLCKMIPLLKHRANPGAFAGNNQNNQQNIENNKNQNNSTKNSSGGGNNGQNNSGNQTKQNQKPKKRPNRKKRK